LRHGARADSNPWGATTLEWQTPDTPPRHGNWGPTLPVVHRWAYDYSVPGAHQDFLPQNFPAPDSLASGPMGGEPSVEQEAMALEPVPIPPSPPPTPEQKS
jgi:heme/copper-type cytochrome/quinol oxidase subunit 1